MYFQKIKFEDTLYVPLYLIKNTHLRFPRFLALTVKHKSRSLKSIISTVRVAFYNYFLKTMMTTSKCSGGKSIDKKLLTTKIVKIGPNTSKI